MNSSAFSVPREFMARCIFAWLFMVYVYFFVSNSLLSQLQQPVFIYPGSDNSFWALHITGIPQFILRHHWAALLFDIAVTVSCLVCIAVPQQRFFTYITVIGTWLFYFCYSSAAGKQYAQVGFILAPVALLVQGQKRFELTWQAFRYWVCFLYVSAGVYKIYYGGFAYPLNMQQVLKNMNAEWLLFNKDGLQAKSIYWLINHPGAAQWFYRATTLVDLSLLIGFFTRRFDRWLLAALLLFHVGNFFLLHISFFEQSLIFAPFLPWQRMADYFHTTYSNE
jgi:hypothetical protein